MPGDGFVSALGLLLSGGPRLVARYRAVAGHQLRGDGHGGVDRGAGRLRAVLMVGGDIAGVTRTMILETS
jgi:ABC-type tungstate transport system substrate-binding protein